MTRQSFPPPSNPCERISASQYHITIYSENSHNNNAQHDVVQKLRATRQQQDNLHSTRLPAKGVVRCIRMHITANRCIPASSTATGLAPRYPTPVLASYKSSNYHRNQRRHRSKTNRAARRRISAFATWRKTLRCWKCARSRREAEIDLQDVR